MTDTTPTNVCCTDNAARALVALFAGNEPPPCRHHSDSGSAAAEPADRTRPLALNDDLGLAAVLGLPLAHDPHFEGGTVPPAA